MEEEKNLPKPRPWKDRAAEAEAAEFDGDQETTPPSSKRRRGTVADELNGFLVSFLSPYIKTSDELAGNLKGFDHLKCRSFCALTRPLNVFRVYIPGLGSTRHDIRLASQAKR